jgi:plastocyanin
MKRTGLIASVAAGVAAMLFAVPALAEPQATALAGTVGPGFTITLKKGGTAVKTLKPGAYTLTVTDKSAIHNFRLRGPGFNKATSVPKQGKTTWNVTLRKGTYTFVCDPHATTMKGTVKVG